jgi:tetratricopeptide (TPR) repeat protein
MAEKLHQANPKANRYVMNLGMAHYRAGQFEPARRYIKQALALGDWAVFWPALAMTYHRLGQADKTRAWLQKADQFSQGELQQALARTPFTLSRPGLHWADWAYFEILRREAKHLIEGKLPADDPALLAALRARAWGELHEHARAKAEWERAVKLKPKDPLVWIARGRYFAERGEHKKADADFAEAAARTPNELNRFLEAGWWAVGPYPHALSGPCPPEDEADPSRAVVAADAAAEYRWQALPTGEYGGVDLRAVSKAGQGSAYAMTYVFSPEERTALLRVGAEGGVRLWHNGRLVHHNPDSTTWTVSSDRVPVTLRAGRNTLLAKVTPKSHSQLLAVRLGDNPVDRGLILNELGMWEEACSWFARAFARQQHDESVAVYYAGLLVFKGERDAYRRLCAETLKPWSSWSGAIACVLAPEGCPDPKRVLQIAEKIAAGVPEDHWWRSALCLALYRAGRFEESIQVINKAKFNTSVWSPVLAMAHHRLGKKEEAQRWLAAADENFKSFTVESLYRTEGLAFYLMYREAKTLIKGAAPKDDAIKALLARAREQFNKLDKATRDYDVALLMQPDQSRLWLARGRRLADLKRWQKADADLARAAELQPDDPQVWRERSRVATGLGQPARAAPFLAKARALEAFVVLGSKGGTGRAFTSLDEAVANALSGDTIEIRGNGPFVTLPVVIQGRALTIRAGAGTRPVIKVEGEGAKSHAPLLTTDAPLIVEGLEFQRWDQKNWVQGRISPTILRATGKSLRVANCRFRANLPDRNLPHRQVAISAATSVCDVRNCEFLCPTEVSVDTSSERVTLGNCVHVGRLALTMGNSAEYRLRHNTLVTESAQALHFFLPAGQRKPNQPAKPTRVEASGNIISAGAVLYVDSGDKPKPLEPREVKKIFPHALTWTGRENLYQGLNHFVTWTGMAEIQPSLGPRDLDGWRKFWGSAETGSKAGSPRFKGGHLPARLNDAPDKLTPDDFRLAKGSAGYRAGKGGKDLGADVDLVGPGRAYERWQKTPEYRQWLKETGQKK